MEARTIGWSIAVVVVATFGFVAMFAIERETSSRDLRLADAALSEARRDLETSQATREKMRERVEQAKKLSADKSVAADGLAKIEAAITAASRKKEELRKAWEAAKSEYETSIFAVRRKMTGTKYATFEAGELTLEDATLKSIDDGLVSLEHSAGLTKLPASRLPPELASSLLPDWNPQLKLNEGPKPAKTAAAKERVGTVVPDAAAPVPEPASAPQTANPHTAQRVKLQNERNALTLKTDAANGELRLKTNTYTRLNAEYQSSRLRSKIVSMPPGLAEAKKAMETLNRQLETARQQYNRISAELQQVVAKENAWALANP